MIFKATIEDQQPQRAAAWARAIAAIKEAECDKATLQIIVREAIWYVPMMKKSPPLSIFRYVSERLIQDPEQAFERDHVFRRGPAATRVRASQSADQIRAILESLVVCAVTEDEHDELGDWDHLDGWERYDSARIKVVDHKEKRFRR